MSVSNNGWGQIGVLMGGNSSERSVSLRSGLAVASALREKGLAVATLDIQGSNLQIVKQLEDASIDFAFIALHGKGGEDGTIQSFLLKCGIPYIGSSPEGSRRAFNKWESKRIFEQKGIPTPKYRLVHKKDRFDPLNNFAFPAFVKPVEEGSSIGIKKIDHRNELERALSELFEEYESLLVEEAILGKELTVGILGEEALPVIELRPKREFYDYTAKYTKGMTEYLVPAPLSGEISRGVRELALRAHQALGLSDFSRVDIMLNDRDEAFVLEANTIPGFTETSLLPKAAREAGLDFGDLCLKLIHLAKERIHINGQKK